MSEQLPPLPGDIEKLLAPVRGVPALPPGVETRLWGPIAAQLAAPPPALPHAPLPKPPPHLPVWLAKWPLAVAFAVGGGAGAGLHARITKPKVVESVVAVAAPEASPPLAPVPAPLPIEPPPAPARPNHHLAPAAPAPIPVIPSTPAPVPNDAALGAERALLEIGRTALARGQPKAAYQAMVDHERRFPSGRLSEERDAIRIQALAAMGQLDAARVLAESFRLTYPKSLLLPAVDRALSKP
jgi:hypothetical protein